MSKKLTKNEERVLRYLYEHRDDGRESLLSEIAIGCKLSENATIAAIRTLREAGYIGGSASDLLGDSMSALKEMDPELKSTSRGYAETIILFASAKSKADEAFLATELSYDPEFVALVGSRLRSAGIWKNDEVTSLHLERWGESSISFFLDASVAIGDLMIVSEHDTDPQYQMTASGKSYVGKLNLE